MSRLALEAVNLSKTFPGGIVGVNDLNLQVHRGAVFGLIGRNGVGKTTTLRLLMGLLRADRGTALVMGREMATADRAFRSRVAYVSQFQQMHAWMTVGELCRYASHFYDSWDNDTARRLAKNWDLPWDRQIGLLSGGQQRKAAILTAFAARPEILLLDEPAAGLDAVARRELIDAIIELLAREGGCTVLFSTHIISDLERVAEYVGIMDHGHVASSIRLDDLLQSTRRVQVVFDTPVPPAGFVIPGALRQEISGPVVTAVVRIENGLQLESIRQMPGVRMQVFPLPLEEVFIEFARQEKPQSNEERSAA